MTVIATAGHVDHGKSTLVRALTGTDPDRWAEEKERGLTIDLGFASLSLSHGRTLSLVDVPGHVRFLRNMLAGVGAVQGTLFVVSAVEGWKPQSEEHLRILELLGMRHAVIALTMSDLVDGELLELATLDVAEHVEGTFAEGAPIVPVSSMTGEGLAELRTHLGALVEAVGAALDRNAPRLWVDRSFAPAGAGTVVTGTLLDGSVRVGDRITVVPTMHEGRIRSLQTHHASVESIRPGNRVAINLSGVNHGDIERGHVLVHPDRWHSSSVIDAQLTVLPAVDHPVTNRGAFLVYVGSGEFPTRLRLLGGVGEIDPGGVGAVRLYLDRPVPTLPGDRFILRESGRSETLGGGHFLDIDPVRPARRATPDGSPERVVEERGWVDVEEFRRLTGHDRGPDIGSWLVSEAALTAATTQLRDRIARAGDLGLDIAVLDDRERALAEHLDDVVIERGRATIGVAVTSLENHRWLADLHRHPFDPPGPEGVPPAEVRTLIRQGLVVESDGVYFSSEALEAAADRLRQQFAGAPSGLTVAEIRDLLQTTRKYALAMLAHFDRNGRTRRRDDYRIPGPRL